MPTTRRDLLKSQPWDRQATPAAGIKPEREREVLAAWAARK
jgi:hypothetical protein